MSTLQRLTGRGPVKPPRWLPGNVQCETIMGSVAYSVSSETSDVDVYGWAISPKEDIFPHLRGRGWWDDGSTSMAEDFRRPVAGTAR